MTNDELGELCHNIKECLEKLMTHLALLDVSIDKKIVADLAWLKLIETIQYPPETVNSANSIIKQTREAMVLASDAGENMSKEIIELGYTCKKWIEEHEDS